MRDEPKSHFIETNGIKLHCKISGEGETVILLHGFPEFWYAWKETIPFLSEEGYKVVAPDLRGYNKSDIPENVKDYAIEQLVEDIKGLIEKTSDSNKAMIVGHDWGGLIAWATAIKYPELVDKLFILNCPHPKEFSLALQRNFIQMFKSYYMLLFKLKKLPEWFVGRNLKRFFTKTLQNGTIPKNIISDEDIDKYVAAFSNKENLTAAINYYRAAGKISYSEPEANTVEEEITDVYSSEPVNKKVENIIPSIFCPVTILWGEQDKYIGKELTFNTFKHCSIRPDIEYIKDATHWIHHEKPSLVNNKILRFLKRKHLTIDLDITKKVGFGQKKEPTKK